MQCTYCKSDQTEIKRSRYTTPIGEMAFVSLACGHSISLATPKYASLDGRNPYPFQEEGINFLNSPVVTGRGKLVADEQGLGKTIQALCFLKDNEARLPVLVITKSKLTRQWMGEIYRWNNQLSFLIAGSGVIPGLKYYVTSVDLLRNIKRGELKKIGFKTIVIDECQSIKNLESKRTQEVMDLARPTGNCKCGHGAIEHHFKKVINYDSTSYNKPAECNTKGCNCLEYEDKSDLFIIGLSGTPILNKTVEYFPILHLIDSSRFPSESRFTYEHVDSYYDGYKMKQGGIRNLERWKEVTKDIIIRRERAEVMPDLPSIDRQIRWVDLTKEAQEEYDKQEKGFLEEYIKQQLEGVDNTMNLLAFISRMRHIIGLSKIPDCIDYVTDFMISTERKICIFVHHKRVGQILKQELDKWLEAGAFEKCLTITGNMSADDLADVQNKFNTDERYKVLIASTIAAGEGLNLQEQCGDCVILERQWNPAKEEQAISRFVRIGFMKSAKVKLNSVIAQYILAIGTIDDWITQLIEEKRSIFDQAVNQKDIEAAEQELMRALMNKILTEGRKKWKLT